MQMLGHWIKRVETLISFSALSILVLSVLWGVLTRYVTERPAVWTTELSGILFTWVVFIGAMTALRDGRHIRVTLLIDSLSPSLRSAVLRLGDLIVLGFLIYVSYLSVLMMQKGATRPSPVLDIPFSYVYLATTICFVGMSVTSALRLLNIIEDPQPISVEDTL
ncbi:MAG: TRAP transporter small permease [Cognatishimia sp.]|uniref:TRAP transporter small permease n=1 Tax=Cognatishimia sp. TaxID=2211648 RepID=UPI003B8D5950